MNCRLPVSFVHGIFQARIMELFAISFPRVSSQTRDRSCIFCIAGGFFTTEPPGKPLLYLRGQLSSSSREKAWVGWSELISMWPGRSFWAERMSHMSNRRLAKKHTHVQGTPPSNWSLVFQKMALQSTLENQVCGCFIVSKILWPSR